MIALAAVGGKRDSAIETRALRSVVQVGSS